MKRYARAAGLAVVMLVAGVGAASAAARPSFDSARAKSGAEKAICGDPTLALAAGPYNARWLCDMSGKAEARGATLVVQEKDAPGWTLVLRRNGAGLVAQEARPPGGKSGDSTPNCGSGGSMDGTCFAVH